MALVGEKLASDATLDNVLCICSGRRPIETSTEGLAYKGPSRSMVTTNTGMNFSQELPPLFLGDTSLKYSGSAFLVEFSFVDLIGFRTPNNAAGLILILGEILPIEVGQEWFGPWGNDCRYKMGRWCCFGG